MNALKAFKKPFEAPQRNVKIKNLRFFFLSGIGTVRVNSIYVFHSGLRTYPC